MTTSSRSSSAPRVAPTRSVTHFSGRTEARIPEFQASFARGFTFEAWVRPSKLAARALLLDLDGSKDGPDLAVVVRGDAVDLEVGVRGGAPRTVTAEKALRSGRWTHVAVVLSERGEARVLIDGAVRASADRLPAPGAGSRPRGALGSSFFGDLAEARLWTRDRSDDEIEASRRRRLSGDEPDLAAYWPLDGLDGGRLDDRSGHGRSARPVRVRLIDAGDLPVTDDDAPSPALALRRGDTIVARNDLARMARGLTLQTWVRIDGWQAETCILEVGDGATWSLAIVTNKAGAPSVRLTEKAQVVASADGERAPSLKAWTHVTAVLTDREVALYLDGERVRSASIVRPEQAVGFLKIRPPHPGYLWKTLTAGAGASAKAINADFAEIRLFTVALREPQIARSVRRTMLGTEDGLAICWRLDAGRGDVVGNAGALGNDPKIPESRACDGVIKGGEWIQESGLRRARPVDARPIRALHLDGKSGHAALPGLERGFGDGYTIEAWVRLEALTGAPIVDLCEWRGPKGPAKDLAAIAGDPFDRITLEGVGATKDLRFVATRGPAGAKTTRALVAAGVLRIDRWTHVAVAVHPGGLVVLHVDGRKAAEQALFTADEVAADARVSRGIFVLGRSAAAAAKHLQGDLAEVRLWGRALSSGELRDRRHLRAHGGELGLVRCYHLDEPDGKILADAGPRRRSGALAGGGALLEDPGLPLWSGDERVGAGVDAACSLMQDPRVVTVKGKRSTTAVPVFEVNLSARTAMGLPDPGCTFEIRVDEAVTIRHDRGDGEVHRAGPGVPIKIQANRAGKARLTIDAGGFKIDGREALRCPLLRVRTGAMPAKQWEVIAPDRQAHEALAATTGDLLRRGAPAVAGRKSTPAPVKLAIGRGAAEELATTVRALMDAASTGAIEIDDSSPLAFAADDADADAPSVGRSLSAGAAARVDGDAPLRRVIPARILPLPEGQVFNFAGGDEEVVHEVMLLAAPELAEESDDEPLSFAARKSKAAGARALRDDLKRLGDLLAGAFQDVGEAVQDAGKAIEGAGEKVADKTQELARELGEAVETAVLRPTDAFMRDLAGDVRDALVVAVRTVDPRGFLVETFQVIVEVGGSLIRTIVDSVEAAIEVMGAFFTKVAAKVADVVEFVAKVFDWGDILETADGLHAPMKAALAQWPPLVRKARGRWEGMLKEIEGALTSHLDGAVRDLGIAAPPRATAAAADPDERTALLVHKLEDNLPAAKLALDVAGVDLDRIARVVDTLDLPGIGRELAAGFKSIDLEEVFQSPEDFLRGGASTLLLGLRGLAQLFLRLVKAGGSAVLEVIEDLLAEVERIANGRIEIPGLTDLIEATILGGRRLTPLMLLAILAAVPYTVAYKLAHGPDAGGPFSGPRSFGDDDAGGWNADAANFVNVICGFVSGLITTIVDVVDNEVVALRAFKLVNTICGAIVCSVAGFPVVKEGDSPVLPVGGWILGVVAAAVAGVDAVNGVVAAVRTGKGQSTSTNEAIADALAYVSAGVAFVQLVWGIVTAISDSLPKPNQSDDEADAAPPNPVEVVVLSAVSAALGSVAGMLPAIPDDEPKVRVIKGAVGGTLLTGQLVTGLVAAGMSLKPSEAVA